ncbi:MAG TPA: PEGA domain-containing protein [Polyangiaceae bacterium]
MTQHTVAFLLTTAALVFARAGWAESTDEELIEQGIALRRERKDDEALDRFRRAYELRPSARAQAQIGLAEQALGRWVDAERDLAAATKIDGDPWIQKNERALSRALAETAQHLAWLRIDTNVDRAELLIDGTRVTALPSEPLRLPAGTVRAELRAEGHESVQRTIEVPAGGTVVLHVVLAPRAMNPVGIDPPASVEKRAVDNGTSLRRTMAWASLGVGAVLVGEAVVAQITREVLIGKYNDDSLCFYGTLTRDQRCNRYKSEAETAQTLAVIGFAAGGAALGASAYFFLTGPRGDKAAAHPITVGVAPRGAFIQWRLRF